MQNNFIYSQPVRIEFGCGKVKELQKIATANGFSRGLLICDKLFVDNGTAEDILKNTPSLVGVYSDITPNPMLSEVTRATATLREVKADYAVALGGGSSMDLAKFACAMVYADGDNTDYFYKRKDFPERRIPLIVIPTTAGTGSEVTSVSVCNDDITGVKAPLAHKNLFAHTALVDPMLTVSVPDKVTAATGIDAMAHALEAYWCNAHQPICDGLAIYALKLIFANLEKAYNHGDDVVAREGMSLGALIAGLAFAPTRTAAVHACSYPLSADYHLSHGEACAFTLDSFIRINGEADNQRMTYLANELGFNDFVAMSIKVSDMKKEFKMKTTLAEVGITDTAKLAADCVSHPLFLNNPAKLNADDVKKIFDNLK